MTQHQFEAIWWHTVAISIGLGASLQPIGTTRYIMAAAAAGALALSWWNYFKAKDGDA